MRVYSGADAAVWRYLELRSVLSAPAAQSMSRIAGSAWAPSCVNPACTSTAHAEVHSRRARRYVERCSRCGTPWVSVPCEVKRPKRRPRENERRSGQWDEGYVELGTLALIVQRVPAPAREVYLAFLDHPPHLSGLDAARQRAIALGLLSPDHAQPEAWVRQRVRQSRNAIHALLALRGLLLRSAA